MRNKWSNLEIETQESIIARVLVSKEDVNDLAQEYNLKASSLSRTIRRVRQRQEKLVRPNIIKPITKTKLARVEDEKFSISIIGDMTPSSNPEHRRMFLNSEKPLTILMFTDAHFPYNDEDAVNCFLRAVKSLPHDIVLNGGDTLDVSGLSKYGKETSDEFNRHLGTEISGYLTFAEQLKDSTDKPVITLFGNHMRRYIYWMYNNPAVMYVEAMQMDNLMKLEEFGWYPSVGDVMINSENVGDINFPRPEAIIHHGSISRKGAGNSARGESDARWISSASGHVHRLAVTYRKTLNEQVFMGEAGTLRTLNATYLANTDWQNGFLYITIVPNNAIYGTPLLIKDGRTFYEGQEI